MEDKKTIVKMAFVYFQEGRWDKAIAEYKKLLTMDSSDLNAHNMLGDAYVKKGELKEAYKEYSFVAEAYSQQGLMDKANVVYRKMAKFDPANLDESAKAKQGVIKQKVAAETALEQGQPDKAIDAYKEIVKNDPEDFFSRQKLAELCEQSGRVKEAIMEYMSIAEAFFSNRLHKKAMAVFQKVLVLEPNNSNAHAGLGEIYAKEGMESEAKKEFLSVAEICIEEGQLDKALTYSQKSVQLKSIEAYYLLGVVYFMKGMFDEAKTQLETILKYKVNHKGALLHLARVFAKQGKMDDSLATYGKALKLEPDNANIHLEMADVYAKKNVLKDAAVHYLAAAECYVKANLFDKAQEVCQKAIAISPDSLEAHKQVSEILVQRDMKKEAAVEFLWLGNYYQAKNDPEKAKQAFASALECDPQSSDLKAKVESAPQVGKIPDASMPIEPFSQLTTRSTKGPAVQETVASAKQPVPNVAVPGEPAPLDPALKMEVDMHAKIGDVFAGKGLFDEALEHYQSILALVPNHPEIVRKVEEIRSKKGSIVDSATKQVMPPQVDVVGRKSEAVVHSGSSGVTPPKQAEEERLFASVQQRKEREHLEKQIDDLPDGSKSEEIPQELMTTTVAEIYLKRGLIKESLKIYKKLLEKDPDNADLKAKINDINNKLAMQSMSSASKDAGVTAASAKIPKKGRVSYV